VIKESARKNDQQRIRSKDKSDRATQEQVLDPRTRMILFRLLDRDYINKIHGCVSTGKEANVYHADLGPGSGELEMQEAAIKIYKTSILVFKDRERYITGEWRYRRGYNKHNPRQMVALWAEKECRNLRRIRKAGIPSPQPILLRKHVLMMEFIGHDGHAAPRLKDADLSNRKLISAYHQCLLYSRILFQDCRLVHGDLSEYNLLWYKGKVYFIDVSQSVEHDHPNALVFLRKDLENISKFFEKRLKFTVLSPRQIFDFVTDPNIAASQLEQYLDEAHSVAKSATELTNREQVDAAVFASPSLHIPRTLSEVVHFERDLEDARRGVIHEEVNYYSAVSGVDPHQLLGVPDSQNTAASASDSDSATATAPASTPASSSSSTLDSTLAPAETTPSRTSPSPADADANVAAATALVVDVNGSTHETGEADREQDGSEEEEEEEEKDSAQEDDEEMDEVQGKRSKRPGASKEQKLTAEEKRELRRQNKKAVKEANRAKRETKMKKHVKKRKQKLARSKK